MNFKKNVIILILVLVVLVVISYFFIGGVKRVGAANNLSCSLSSDMATAGGQITISAVVNFTASEVWAKVENQYGQGEDHLNMSSSDSIHYNGVLTVDSSYSGKNNAAVFATVSGGETILCNPGDGSAWLEYSPEDIHLPKSYVTKIVEFRGKMWRVDRDIWNSADGSLWHQVSSTVPWVAREDFGLVVYDNKIWLMGGRKADQSYVSDIWNSPDGVNWQQVTASAPWSARSRFSLAVLNNKIYLHSGQGLVGAVTTVFADCWSYDNSAGWQLLTDTLTNGRVFNPMVVFNNGSGDKLWIVGGVTTGNVFLNDSWSSPDGINWTHEVPIGDSWSPRFLHQSVVFDNKLWVISGRIELSPNTKVNDVWSTSDGVNWNQEVVSTGYPATGTQPSKWTIFLPKEGHAALVFNQEIWVVAGLTGRLDLTNDIWHSNNGINWTLVGTHYGAEFRPRVEGGVVVAKRTIDSDSRIWLMGGYAVNPNGLVNDIWYTDDGVNWHCFLGPYTTEANGIQCENVGTPTWSARWGADLIFYDNAFYLIGGCASTTGIVSGWWSCPAASLLKDVYKSTDGLTWVAQTTPPWTKRLLPDFSVFNNKIWLTGGSENSSTLVHDVWSFDGTSWTHEPNASWSARMGHNSVVFNDGSGEKLWLMGGYDKDGTFDANHRKNDVWSFDGTNWQCVAGSDSGCLHPAAAWPIRYGFGLTVYNNRMFVIAGNWHDDTWSSKDGYNWDLAGDGLPFGSRDFLDAVTFENRVFAISGEAGSGDNNDAWVTKFFGMTFYLPESEEWQVIVTADVIASLTLNLSGSSCNFGSFYINKINTCSYGVDITTNASAGFSAYIRSDGALRNANHSLADLSDGAVTATSEEYGYTPNLSQVECQALNNQAISEVPASAMTTSDQTIATASGPIENDSLTLCHAASITPTTPAGAYSQSIYITAVGNY